MQHLSSCLRGRSRSKPLTPASILRSQNSDCTSGPKRLIDIADRSKPMATCLEVHVITNAYNSFDPSSLKQWVEAMRFGKLFNI